MSPDKVHSKKAGSAASWNMTDKKSVVYGDLGEDDVSALFSKFQSDFETSYASPDETSERFAIFKKNLGMIDKLNKVHPHALFGITKFSDKSETERAVRRSGNSAWEEMQQGLPDEIVAAAKKGPDAVAALMKTPEYHNDKKDAKGRVDWITVDDCVACGPGYACVRGSGTKVPCPGGRYCHDGTGDSGNCAAGHYCERNSHTPTPENVTHDGVLVADVCPPGAFCVEASATPALCPPGSYSASLGNTDPSDCVACAVPKVAVMVAAPTDSPASTVALPLPVTLTAAPLDP